MECHYEHPLISSPKPIRKHKQGMKNHSNSSDKSFSSARVSNGKETGKRTGTGENSLTPIDKDVDCISKTCYLFSRTARRVWFANQRFLRCLVVYTSTNSTTMANDPKSVDDYHYHRQVGGNHDEATRY